MIYCEFDILILLFYQNTAKNYKLRMQEALWIITPNTLRDKVAVSKFFIWLCIYVYHLLWIYAVMQRA